MGAVEAGARPFVVDGAMVADYAGPLLERLRCPVERLAGAGLLGDEPGDLSWISSVPESGVFGDVLPDPAPLSAASGLAWAACLSGSWSYLGPVVPMPLGDRPPRRVERSLWALWALCGVSRLVHCRSGPGGEPFDGDRWARESLRLVARFLWAERNIAPWYSRWGLRRPPRGLISLKPGVDWLL